MKKLILNTSELKKKVTFLKKKNNNKIVLCHGVFDVVHIGHIKHFEKAKKFGDILIVSITADKHVKKGPGKPLLYLMIRYFSQKEWQVGSSLRFLHEYIMKMQQVNRNVKIIKNK